MRNIVILDDHEIIRYGLAEKLKSSGEYNIIGEADTIEKAKALFCKLAKFGTDRHVDCIILDIDLGHDYGLSLLHWLNEQFGKKAPPVLIFSIYEDYAHIQAARSLGARGYLSKGSSSELLFDALSKIIEGGVYMEPRLQNSILNTIHVLSVLTRREQDVFLLVKKGVSNRDVAKQLGITMRTVENNLSAIYSKLDVSSRKELEAM
jgi:DNA-binding NarL/FixJ family response regulator